MNVSSHVHFFTYAQGIDFSKVTGASAHVKSDTARNYGQSKLAQIIFTRDMQALSTASRRAFESDIYSLVCTQALSKRKGLSKHENGWKGRFLRRFSKPFLKTVEQGASTTCFAAFHKDAKFSPGITWPIVIFSKARNNRATAPERTVTRGHREAPFGFYAQHIVIMMLPW